MSLQSSMFERRLPEVTQHIEADFEALMSGEEIYQGSDGASNYVKGYGLTGTKEIYTWGAISTTSAMLLRDGLKVLDLGCGAGRIVREYNARNPETNRAYGITAHQYYAPDPAIFVGNVHHLDTLYPATFNQLDLCMSHYMFRHLADPLSVFEMVARRLKQGGELVTDQFRIRADTGSMVAAHTLQYLTQSGHFEIIGEDVADLYDDYLSDPNTHHGHASYLMPPLRLKRTSPAESPIELPVSCNIEPGSGRWQYFAV